VTRQVLLIDDEPALLSILSFYLEDAGYRVLEAADGQAAMEMLQSHRPDAIICDLHLPGMNGLEICRKVRQNPALQAIPFTLLTGTTKKLDPRQQAGLGIDRYLIKPFEPEDLLAILETDPKVLKKA
jgi:CheY-like chemotaxis protein